MRTTNEICVAVQEGGACTDEELRYCVEALRVMLHFAKNALRSITNDPNAHPELLKLRITLAEQMMTRLFTAGNTPVDHWLTPTGLPGTPEYRNRIEAGKALVEKVTGVKL